jgi:hypothetical protein
MEGVAPNLEKLYEQKALKKLSYSLQGLLGLYKPRDRQLIGMMNKAVIPLPLVQAKNWYQHMIKKGRSKRFVKVCKDIYRDLLSPLVDMFTPYPIPIETILKDEATDQGEINVFGLPKMGKRSKDEDGFAEDEKNLEIKKMKEELQREARGNFEGPEDDDESPFLSYKHSEDVEV